ncbi:hypothetical protein [Sphingobacterium kyonggiense]
MKKLEFTTGKGRFVVVDESELPKIDQLLIGKDDKFIKLSEITEEQAREIIEHAGSPWYGHKDFTNPHNWFSNPLDSLHSLIKSKGWFTSNPFEKFADECGCEEAESRTLHNPVIFKIK